MNRSYIKLRADLRIEKVGNTYQTEYKGKILSSDLFNERKAISEIYDQFWDLRRKEILERDNYRCRACGGNFRLSVDHIKARSSGGTDDPENLRTLCQICHDKRHSEKDWKC